jgi:hypothetical protein
LFEAGENRFGTDEVAFSRIFTCESFAHLRVVFDEYLRLTGHTIEKAIESEMSTSIKKAFLTVSEYRIFSLYKLILSDLKKFFAYKSRGSAKSSRFLCTKTIRVYEGDYTFVYLYDFSTFFSSK